MGLFSSGIVVLLFVSQKGAKVLDIYTYIGFFFQCIFSLSSHLHLVLYLGIAVKMQMKTGTDYRDSPVLQE